VPAIATADLQAGTFVEIAPAELQTYTGIWSWLGIRVRSVFAPPPRNWPSVSGKCFGLRLYGNKPVL